MVMKPPPNVVANVKNAPVYTQERTYINIIEETLTKSEKLTNGNPRSRSFVDSMMGDGNVLDHHPTAWVILEKGGVINNKS